MQSDLAIGLKSNPFHTIQIDWYHCTWNDAKNDAKEIWHSLLILFGHKVSNITLVGQKSSISVLATSGISSVSYPLSENNIWL